MDESYYYYYCGGGGGGGNEAHFELALVLSADVSFCMDISNPSTLVDTHKTRQKGDAAAYLLFLKRQETRRRRRRRKVCRLKSFVRLLISNCHPSLAPPLVSDSLLIKKKRNCFFFFVFFLFIHCLRERKKNRMMRKDIFFFFDQFSSTSFVVFLFFLPQDKTRNVTNKNNQFKFVCPLLSRTGEIC